MLLTPMPLWPSWAQFLPCLALNEMLTSTVRGHLSHVSWASRIGFKVPKLWCSDVL